jgi:hypothetical protein
MAGIYSRTKYDLCDIDNVVSISTGVGNYTTSDVQIANAGLCVSNIQPFKSKAARVNALDAKNGAVLTDIESHLWNIDMPMSNCSAERTLPEKLKKGNVLTGGLLKNEACGEQIVSAYTKLDIPSNIYREMTTHRFDYPIIPPEHFVYTGITGTEQVDNNRSGVNTRLQAKDYFRKSRNM